MRPDRTPYTTVTMIQLYRFRQGHGADTPENVAYRAAVTTDPSNPLSILNRFFSNNPLRDIQHTIENIRANLPALLAQLETGGPDEQSGDEDEPTLYGNSDYGDGDRVDTM